MTLFLRNQDNQTIVDIELFTKDGCVELNSTICILTYSKLLFELLINKSEDEIKVFIQIFDNLSELRGWMWETYFATKKNTESEYSNVLKEVTNILKNIAEQYNLIFTVD
jgi:hypothetical protein